MPEAISQIFKSILMIMVLLWAIGAMTARLFGQNNSTWLLSCALAPVRSCLGAISQKVFGFILVTIFVVFVLSNIFGGNKKTPSVKSLEWIPGNVHIHSTFSDGSQNIPERVAESKKAGARFLIMTDHFESIGSQDKVAVKFRYLFNHKCIDYGFDDYFRNCHEQTNRDFVTIPGAEITTEWNAENDTIDKSHTLVLGDLSTINYTNFDAIQGKNGAQSEIISTANSQGILPVAAHPSLINTSKFSWPPWEWSRLRYDKRIKNYNYDGSETSYSNGIAGIELFNDETQIQDAETFSFYLSKVAKHSSVFVIAGCDNHISGDPKNEERWERITWVNPDSLTSEGILTAFRNGKSYAARWGAKILEANYLPSTSVVTVNSKPEFNYTVEIPKMVYNKIIHIYRDGNLISTSESKFNISTKKFNYKWTDSAVAAGEHWYVFVVEGYLVTSPIRINITTN